MRIDRDYGGEELVFDIDEETRENNNFRTAIWTGQNMQITLMQIDTNSEIGLEKHDTHDQFLKVVQGRGRVFMGKSEESVEYLGEVERGYAIVIPAGYWHNLKNSGGHPLKLYSIYAPPVHKKGTVHQTKQDCMNEEL